MKKFIPIVFVLLLIFIIKDNTLKTIELIKGGRATDHLRQQLKEEEKRNRFLKERLFYVNTPEFVEEEAREKLGLVKPGEHTVIVPSPPLPKNDFSLADKPNWKKWLELFF